MIVNCSLSIIEVCRIALSLVWNGISDILLNWFGTEFNKFRVTVRNPSSSIIFRNETLSSSVTKPCEIYVLQVASMVGLSPDFLAVFHEATSVKFQLFEVSEIVWHSTAQFLKFQTVFRNSVDR